MDPFVIFLASAVAAALRSTSRIAGPGSELDQGSDLPLALTMPEYIAAYPEMPEHMTRRGLAEVDSGMVLADPGDEDHGGLGWPPYDGGYLRWTLMDVRLYVAAGLKGWEVEAVRTPWRVYVRDADDWNVERLFATEAEAREVITLLGSGPVSLADVEALGLKTS